MIKPKKYLGQHFLNDENIAKNIVNSLKFYKNNVVLEIGPGMGVLTKYLIAISGINLYVVEKDIEAINYINQNIELINSKIIHKDFLELNLEDFFNEQLCIIGNFPYNISSQILFKVIDNKEKVCELVGMFQREVAKRVVAGKDSKTYGILSIFIQAFYETQYLFEVDEKVFFPQPKVKSAVIRLQRKENISLGCDEAIFRKVVKTAFNQRRKMLQNSIKALNVDLSKIPKQYLNKRPENLSVNDFVNLTNCLYND